MDGCHAFGAMPNLGVGTTFLKALYVSSPECPELGHARPQVSLGLRDDHRSPLAAEFAEFSTCSGDDHRTADGGSWIGTPVAIGCSFVHLFGGPAPSVRWVTIDRPAPCGWGSLHVASEWSARLAALDPPYL